MKTDVQGEQATLVRYFLGELEPHEQERVEERYMLDEDYAGLRDEVELALVDAYVADTLEAQERRHFERSYLMTPERWETVKAAYLSHIYRERIAQPEREQVAARWRWKLPRLGPIPALALTLVALILAAVVLMRMLHRESSAPLRNEAKSSAPLPAHPSQEPDIPAHAPAPVKAPPPPAQLAANRPPALPPHDSYPPAASDRMQENGRPKAFGRLPLGGTPPAAASGGEVVLPIAQAPRVPLVIPNTPPPTLVIGDINAEAVKGAAHRIFQKDVDVSAGISGLLSQSLKKDDAIRVERQTPDTPALPDRDAYRLTADVATFGERETPPPLSEELVKKLGTPPAQAPPPRYIRATVLLRFRLTDVKTGEIVQMGQVQGVSSGEIDLAHTSDQFAGMYGRSADDGTVDMTSSGFSQTLIGEATVDACNKLAALLKARTAKQ